MRESKTVEFKREYTENLKYEILAFANTDGGTIYVGVENDGTAVGISDMDKTMLSITNMIRDSIRPDITPFTDVHIAAVDGKEVIAIDVQRGTDEFNFPFLQRGLFGRIALISESISQFSDSLARHMLLHGVLPAQLHREIEDQIKFKKDNGREHRNRGDRDKILFPFAGIPGGDFGSHSDQLLPRLTTEAAIRRVRRGSSARPKPPRVPRSCVPVCWGESGRPSHAAARCISAVSPAAAS